MLKTLKSQVLYVLERYPETRNNDTHLTITIWVVFYVKSLFKDSTGQWAVNLSKINGLPREDNVKRVRAKIQNEERRFLPTDINVLKKRGIAAKAIRTGIHKM